LALCLMLCVVALLFLLLATNEVPILWNSLRKLSFSQPYSSGLAQAFHIIKGKEEIHQKRKS
jgi:hypothetical protein